MSLQAEMQLSRLMLGSIKCGRHSIITLTVLTIGLLLADLGTMGFGFPSAIGAQLAHTDKTVVAITGDGGFQMTLQELSVIKELKLPVKIVILNNECLGMVRQWQESFYEERYSHSLMPEQPDFVKLAEAYGIKGYRATNEKEARAVFEEAFNTPEPVLIDFRVMQKGKCLSDGCTGHGTA